MALEQTYEVTISGHAFEGFETNLPGEFAVRSSQAPNGWVFLDPWLGKLYTLPAWSRAKKPHHRSARLL